jgi:hypothetical protein
MPPDKAPVSSDVLTDQWAFIAPAGLEQLDKFNLDPGQSFSVAEEQQVEEKDWDQLPMSKAVAAAVEKQKAKLADLYKARHSQLLCSFHRRLTPFPPPPSSSTHVTGLLCGTWRQVRSPGASSATPMMTLSNSLRRSCRAITRPQRIPANIADSTEKTNKLMEGVVQGCSR